MLLTMNVKKQRNKLHCDWEDGRARCLVRENEKNYEKPEYQAAIFASEEQWLKGKAKGRRINSPSPEISGAGTSPVATVGAARAPSSAPSQTWEQHPCTELGIWLHVHAPASPLNIRESCD